MKKALLVILLLNSIFGYGQSYSSMVADSEIEQFVQWEILNTPKYTEDRKRGLKKIFKKSISWKAAMIHVGGPFEDTLSFESKFYHFLKQDTIFSKEDIDFLSQQYESEVQGNWETDFNGSKMVKSSGNNVHHITIPLFSVDKRKVMFWKYFYCGSVCAHACVFIYEKANESSWKLINKYGCWIS
ncbi:hypothetical protein [Rufibacter roseus]|uniref:Lipoprotein n=1 Tax=Rufibacter roseus TaxID=1567108 RepID=A0ABW2DQS0_9BACT|nr:hypothetical protein [Rufibacter roseus]